MIIDSRMYSSRIIDVQNVINTFPEMNFNDLLSRCVGGTGMPVVVVCCLIKEICGDNDDIRTRIALLKSYYRYDNVIDLNGVEL